MCLLETREREEGGEKENGGMRKGIGEDWRDWRGLERIGGRDGVNGGVKRSNGGRDEG